MWKDVSTMKTNLDCIYCILNKSDERFTAISDNQQEKLEFMKNVFSLLGSMEPDLPSPYVSKRVTDLLKIRFGDIDRYVEEKKKFNDLMLSVEDKLEKQIENSQDPLLTALKISMVANFIDYGTITDISDEKLSELLETAEHQKISDQEYINLKTDLEKASKLTYLLDNCGEIVADKLFINTIKKIYKNITVTAVVRGKPVFNDVTMLDARETGLIDCCKVIDNGTDVPGTFYNSITNDAKNALDVADIIISKGQGNFETLTGSKRNIYFIFLCKCQHMKKLFKTDLFKGLFVNDLRIDF